jgi:hypothetical protein
MGYGATVYGWDRGSGVFSLCVRSSYYCNTWELSYPCTSSFLLGFALKKIVSKSYPTLLSILLVFLLYV